MSAKRAVTVLRSLVWGVSQGPFGRYAKRAIGSSVIFRRSGARRRPGLERVPALSTEFEGRRVLESTLGAAAGKEARRNCRKISCRRDSQIRILNRIARYKSMWISGHHQSLSNRVAREVLWKAL
jgi:hypothetical protein